MEEDGYNRMSGIRGFYSQVHMLYCFSDPEKFNRFSFPSDTKFIKFIITVEILLVCFCFFYCIENESSFGHAAFLQQHKFCIFLDFPILEEEINPNIIQQAPW